MHLAKQTKSCEIDLKRIWIHQSSGLVPELSWLIGTGSNSVASILEDWFALAIYTPPSAMWKKQDMRASSRADSLLRRDYV